MEQPDLCAVLNDRYPLHVDSLKLVRDSGSTAYMACAGGKPYFLRVTKPAFYDTVKPSLDIHVFLLRQGFSVPPIVFTKDLSPCVPIGGADGRRFGILYDYIEGDECDPETDAEDIGALLGRFHRAMKTYPHPLVKRDRHFYVGRYIDILRKRRIRRRRPWPRTERPYGKGLRICRAATAMGICIEAISIKRRTGGCMSWISTPPARASPCTTRR